MQQVATIHDGEPNPNLNPLDSTGLCLLSLDGGGVCGLSTLYILKGLMDRLNQARPEGSPAKKPCEVFDLIGGTSTGGLIAIMLGRLEMDVDDCIRAFIKLMKIIFGKPSRRGLSRFFGNIEPQFDTKKVEDAINEVFISCGAKPTDLFNDQAKRGCRVFVCSITQETKEIVRLRSYPMRTKPEIPVTICQAARATSATTFFEPVSIGARKFANGALGANNPVDEVEGEASDIWCEETADLKRLVKCFISIGTGHPGKRAMEDKLSKSHKTILALVTQTEYTAKLSIAKWRQHYDNKRYFRFNVDQGLQDIRPAEYQEQGLIESATEGYLDHQQVIFQVRDCVKNLVSKQSMTNLSFSKEIQRYKKTLALLEQWQGRARWQVPFERNNKFTGHKELLNSLMQKLAQNSTTTTKIAIMGLGGIGKTQLVLELAHCIREHHAVRGHYAVYWIPVDSLANLQTTYRKIAQKLCLPGYEESGVDIPELVQAYLSDETIGPWLLIFDNADDIDLWTSPLSKARAKRLIDYMPQSKLGAILWTTRDRKVATGVARENVVTLEQMDESSALEMMRNYLILGRVKNKNDECILRGILQKLAYLPLAIVQAAAFINVTGESLKAYEALLSSQDDEVLELLNEQFEDDGRYPGMENAVAKTWLISFDQIRRRSSLAFIYLGFMACVDPKDIPRSLLPPSESSIQQASAIGILESFSFITRHEDRSAFDLHRLVHLVTRGWLKQNGELLAHHEQVVERLSGLLSNTSQTNRVHWRSYIAHAYYAMSGELKERRSKKEVNLAQGCGDYLNYDGRYREAETMYQIVFVSQEKVLGPEHPDTLTSISNLGSVFNSQGKYDKAEAMHRRASEGYQKALGSEHPYTLASVSNLGSALDSQGKYDEAEAIHQRNLEGSEKVLGLEHPDTLTSVSKVGSFLSSQGNYEEAESLHQRALGIREKILGPEHPHTLTSISNLGSVLNSQGKYEEAESLHQRALRIQERILGREHPDTLTSVSNLGSVFNSQGKYDKAEAMHRWASEGYHKTLGSEHPYTLTSVCNLGSVLNNQGKYEDAESLHQRTLQIQERILGLEHPDTLISVSNLGSVLSRQGVYDKAEAMHQRALEGYQKVSGPEHPYTLSSVNNLGSALDSQGKYDIAEAMYRRALEGSEKVLGLEHPDTLTSVSKVGSILFNQGKYKEAEAMYQRALQAREKVLGLEHPDTLTSFSKVGSILSKQGKYEEAEAINQRALAIREKVLGLEHPNTLTSVSNLGAVLDNQGKYGKAEAMYRRALEGYQKVLGPEHPYTLTSISNVRSVLSRQGKCEGL